MDASLSLPESHDSVPFAARRITTARRRRAPRVAIIEDSGSIAFGMQRTLEADGYEVYVAQDDGRALLLIQEIDPTPFGLSEFLVRIEALIRRGEHVAVAASRTEELGFGDVRINPAALTVSKAGRGVALTPRELDLLLALVRHPGVVLSRTSLLREVWGHRAEVMTRTVDIHVAELRRKLEDVPGRPRHFITVWKRGYRFDP